MSNEHEWLCDNIHNLKQKVRFKDRIEYRISGILDNPVGPAIVYNNGEKVYYIKGSIIDEKDWNILNRRKKINKLLNKTKKDD